MHEVVINPVQTFSEVIREHYSKGERDQLSAMSNQGDIDNFCNKYGLYEDNAVEDLDSMPEDQRAAPWEHQPPLCNLTAGSSSAPVSLEPLNFNDVQSRIPTMNDIREEHRLSPFLASLELLSNHSARCKNFNREKASTSREETSTGGLQKLSTDQILRLAGERFVQFASSKFININMGMRPYGSTLTGVTEGEKQDVELVQLLLTAAEKICYQQLDPASRLLNLCERLASNTGTPVQRAVFYFAGALRARIERETGRSTSRSTKETKGEKGCSKWKYDPAVLAWYLECPPLQAIMFTGVQTILDSIEEQSKVHLIDLQMRTGVHWAVVLPALAKRLNTYPIEHLKLTVVERTDKQSAEATGRLLENLARSLNLPFSFQVVFIPDMKDLRVEQFGAEFEETIVVYAPFVLGTMISKPTCLENLMQVIKRLHPSIILVHELEANHNSPAFVNRFVEALFTYGAFFDELEDSMDRDNETRMAIEASIFRWGIHDIVACEGSERTIRSVKLEVWRAFFARFGMVEAQVSQTSRYQAHLVLQSFACGNSCSLDTKGKSLIVEWKGTPLYSLSVWKLD